jgi:hypothetical protein
MSTFSLHEWLQSEQAAGTLDSEGEFTLVQSKAWEKLGAFQLPFPEAWVLKLVQAAMAEGSARIAVTQTREETEFELYYAPDWSSIELEKAIFDTQHKAERSLNHLAIAVRALALKRTRPFSMRYSDGHQVAWNGSAFTPLKPDEPRPGTFTLTATNYEFGESKLIFSTGNSRAAQFRAEITKALTEHCHLSGDRITLDSRPLTCYWTDPDFGKTDTSHPLTVLEAEPLQEWTPMTVEGHFLSPVASLNHKKIAVALPEIESRVSFSVAAMLSFFYRPELFRKDLHLDKWLYHPLNRSSQVLWYDDGVIVSREPLGFEAAVGVGLVVPTEGLPTDLTGFKPSEIQMKRDRIARSIELIRPQISRLRSAIGKDPFAVKGVRPETVVSGFVGAGVAFAVPIIGVPWVVSSGYKISKEVKENKKLQSAYNDAFGEMVSFFGEVHEE